MDTGQKTSRGLPDGIAGTSPFRLLIALACSAFAHSALAGTVHPLDPLSEQEIASAASIISASGSFDEPARAATITLKEPDKREVLNRAKGDPVIRRAFAILRTGGETFEAVVNLTAGTLERWDRIAGAQPAIQSAEWAQAQRLVKADPRWRAAMKRRGHESFDDIFCESLSAGYFADPEAAGRRLMKMPCYDISGARNNIYARPVEGLIATVDLDAQAVLGVVDEGAIPPVAGQHDFHEGAVAALRDPMRPVRNVALDGWNFSLDGRTVRWQGWSFHLGFDQRFGPVLSLISYKDGNRFRPVLYQAHISEVFVPYMEPTPGWSFRTYLDGGEYGLGALSSPLQAGTDCPDNSVFVDAALATQDGRPYPRKNAVCVFERDAGGPLWRHWESLHQTYEGRPATELVVRSIPSIAHYDYVIDWVFRQSGEIAINIGATGIDAVKGVAVRSMADPGAADATGYGSLVAPGLVAVNHDHYFSIRLDFDVDGPANTFVRERLEPVRLPDGNPRRSLWRLRSDPLSGEGALSVRDGPQVWRIENSASVNALGGPTGYQIQGHGPTSLLAPDDWPQRRAAFSAHNLWITARREGELYAAGDYPNQSAVGDGLPAYVNGESVAETDLVAWYTMGFHHVTRPEDWPVLSTVWNGVKLRPFGFFDRNPALGVRRHFSKPRQAGR